MGETAALQLCSSNTCFTGVCQCLLQGQDQQQQLTCNSSTCRGIWGRSVGLTDSIKLHACGNVSWRCGSDGRPVTHTTTQSFIHYSTDVSRVQLGEAEQQGGRGGGAGVRGGWGECDKEGWKGGPGGEWQGDTFNVSSLERMGGIWAGGRW